MDRISAALRRFAVWSDERAAAPGLAAVTETEDAAAEGIGCLSIGVTPLANRNPGSRRNNGLAEVHVGTGGRRPSRNRWPKWPGIRSPRILILDEGTSHLDVDTERAVNAALSNLAITRIVVAHRPETIQAAGRTFAMVAGAVLKENADA